MIEELIKNFGGLASMSKITGIPKTTIFSWKNKGRPPAWRIDHLKYCAQKSGIQWPNDFYNIKQEK